MLVINRDLTLARLVTKQAANGRVRRTPAATLLDQACIPIQQESIPPM
jgi:hypothetical protein